MGGSGLHRTVRAAVGMDLPLADRFLLQYDLMYDLEQDKDSLLASTSVFGLWQEQVGDPHLKQHLSLRMHCKYCNSAGKRGINMVMGT